MEQVIPDADPEDWESDPIIDAAELNESGDHAAARALLMKQLEQDLRCLDAHAHLGNWLMDHWPDDALRHYEAGMRIGELSLPPGFDGVLPWGLTDGWRDMADFVATVGDRALRQRLSDAIEGKGAFGRFKQALQSAPAERDRWFEWEGERLEEEARAWLASEGIESVPRAKA